MLGNKNTDRLDSIFGEKCPSPKYEAPKNPTKDNNKFDYELKDLINSDKGKLTQCEVNTLRENNDGLIKFLKDKGLIEEYLNSID